jgi:hypothetical protein
MGEINVIDYYYNYRTYAYMMVPILKDARHFYGGGE